MVTCYYICADSVYSDKRCSPAFEEIGCIKGDRSELKSYVEAKKDFCRDQKAISYLSFRYSIDKNTVLYVKDDRNDRNEDIVGCCSINIVDKRIFIHGICVPDGEMKGIGTLLLTKIKELALLLKVERIILSADPSVQGFYEKSGFTKNTTTSRNTGMTYIVKGGKKIKGKKSNRTHMKTNSYKREYICKKNKTRRTKKNDK
uniref:N-acetyltransferase domain-containing protein n=1 Tax=viral metagenome TaxID=1070528 RepID=A0A6C0KPA3_9ZZZZ